MSTSTPKPSRSVLVKQLSGGGGRKVIGTQSPDAPLTDMQRAFVHHLVHNNMSAKAAARHAGYAKPHTDAYDLKRNPKIKAAIARAREEYAKASGMTKQKVIDGFAEAIDLGRIKGDPISMISGWREIGKMCGFYEPQKTEITVSVQGQVLLQRLNSMSDEELLRLAETDPSVLDGEFTAVTPEALPAPDDEDEPEEEADGDE